MGNLLSRDALLSKDKLQIEKVEFENGDFVYVTEMTGQGRDDFDQSMVKIEKEKDGKGIEKITIRQVTENFRSKLAVCTVCDENGTLLFAASDWPQLSISIGAKKLEKIVNTAQKLNGMSDEDKENLIKNLKPEVEGNSSSVSAKN